MRFAITASIAWSWRLMTDAVTNEPTGIHRTFLNPDGKKIERKMLGRQGVVRITPDEDVTYGLGIAEGVEDAIRNCFGMGTSMGRNQRRRYRTFSGSIPWN